MNKYHISLQEKLDDEFLPIIWFECEAEDAEHAREYATNAYPECKIISEHLVPTDYFGDEIELVKRLLDEE